MSVVSNALIQSPVLLLPSSSVIKPELFHMPNLSLIITIMINSTRAAFLMLCFACNLHVRNTILNSKSAKPGHKAFWSSDHAVQPDLGKYWLGLPVRDRPRISSINAGATNHQLM